MAADAGSEPLLGMGSLLPLDEDLHGKASRLIWLVPPHEEWRHVRRGILEPASSAVPATSHHEQYDDDND
jgi:hypothetical protein